MRLSALLLVLAACSPTVATNDCELPAPEQPITLPDGCREDPSCELDTIAEETCGRAYVCAHERPDGTMGDVCVIAQDCTCLEELDARCEMEVEIPDHCD